MTDMTEWWRNAVFYQIYPRSFYDSNEDGVGDLVGIKDKLDYVADLGVDAIWISPFLKSPMRDFGYDVSDYRDVDPMFGSLKDFDALLEKAHNLGLKIIIDMILSHTSSDHPWFVESRSSQDNDRSDWYVWSDPSPDGTPPNNWRSLFGGEAWSFETRREQYFMHNFLKDQPDLNFHNPDVQNEMLDVCKFWLDRGIDGFRLDVINFLFHDEQLRNNPARESKEKIFATQYEKLDPYSMQQHIYDKSRPENVEFIKRLRKLMDQYPGTMSLGEIGDDDSTAAAALYTSGDDMLNTAYEFNLLTGEDITASKVETAVTSFFDQEHQGWPSWAFCNHDVIRVVTRWGKKFGYDTNPDFAKMLLSLLPSLRGTIFMYQGEELGLQEAQLTYDQLQDPWGKYLWPEWQGRDGCRTPVPWDNKQRNAGFSSATETWLPIPQYHSDRAIEQQKEDDNSTLHFTKEFLAWRKTQDTLLHGEITFLNTGDDHLLHFTREHEGNTTHCIFNLDDTEKAFQIDGVKDKHASKYLNAEFAPEQGSIALKGFGFCFISGA